MAHSSSQGVPSSSAIFSLSWVVDPAVRPLAPLWIEEPTTEAADEPVLATVKAVVPLTRTAKVAAVVENFIVASPWYRRWKVGSIDDTGGVECCC